MAPTLEGAVAAGMGVGKGRLWEKKEKKYVKVTEEEPEAQLFLVSATAMNLKVFCVQVQGTPGIWVL